MHDYNTLPVGNYRQLKVAAIDGTDSCIMEHGWEGDDSDDSYDDNDYYW